MSTPNRSPKLPDGHFLNPNTRLDPGKQTRETQSPTSATPEAEPTQTGHSDRPIAMPERKAAGHHRASGLAANANGLAADLAMVVIVCIPPAILLALTIWLFYAYLYAPLPDLSPDS